MLKCSMTIQWVDPGNEQSRKIICSHAAREGIRKMKRARQTKLVKSAVVLNRPLPWRKLAYQPTLAPISPERPLLALASAIVLKIPFSDIRGAECS
jgi:hypothetical protein